MTGIISEESGKTSFSRAFGAAVLLSSLAGWWLEGLSLLNFTLPDQTTTYVLVGLLPYVSNKMFQTIAPYLGRR